MNIFDEIDQSLYLTGDEDGNVELHCQKCDREGLPIVFYTRTSRENPYREPIVILVTQISEMFTVGVKHISTH